MCHSQAAGQVLFVQSFVSFLSVWYELNCTVGGLLIGLKNRILSTLAPFALCMSFSLVPIILNYREDVRLCNPQNRMGSTW